jgi:predicted AAA+ superfamily ATPase
MRYNRDISQKIHHVCQFFPALVLTGGRQTGKTTLLKALFPHYSYASLDLPADAQLAEEDPDTFLAKYPPPVIIDEVQYGPKLFRHLKVRIDRQRNKRGQYILTGSQKFNLMKEISESLAGRCGLLELEPFSVNELGGDYHTVRKAKGLAYCLTRGTFPQLWDEPTLPREDFFRGYIATYIERDVRQILNITSLRDFDRFMRVCALRTGQLVNKSEIAKEVGVSPKTINDWLSILHAGNQVILLEPYFKNIGKRVVKSPKLYFSDTGLVSFLMGINESTVLDSPHLGHLWETFVLSELRKSLFLRHPEATLWFYRDQQKEADFVISYGSKLYLLDAKWKEIPPPSAFKNLCDIQSYFSEASSKVCMITPSQDSFPVAPEKHVVSGFAIADWQWQ